MAAALAVGVQVPQQGVWGWFVLVLLGVTAGAVTLLAAWLCCGRQRLWIRILSTVVLLILLVMPLSWCEETVGIVGELVSFGAWPPETIQFGQAAGRGGLFVDYLVAGALEGIGHRDLHDVTRKLSPEQCQLGIAKLQQVECDRESLDNLFYRERVWAENVYGWYGHLGIVLADLVGVDSSRMRETIRKNMAPRHEAITRLLMVELALQAFQQERGTYPQHLDQLVPQLLPQVPADPFAAAGMPLTYRRTDHGYVLYSWSPDRDDDGGIPPKANSGKPDWMYDGDLRLDFIFPARGPVEQKSGSGAEEENKVSARREADVEETDGGIDADREERSSAGWHCWLAQQ